MVDLKREPSFQTTDSKQDNLHEEFASPGHFEDGRALDAIVEDTVVGEYQDKDVQIDKDTNAALFRKINKRQAPIGDPRTSIQLANSRFPSQSSSFDDVGLLLPST
jgi:hypothetical protein